MTKPAFRRVAVFVGTAALAAGGGVASQGDDATRPSTPSVTSQTAPEVAAAPADEAPADKA